MSLVHFTIHSNLAGSWGCAYNLSAVYEEHKAVYSRELIGFVGISGKAIWLDMGKRGVAEYMQCGAPQWTNCTCGLDFDALDADDVYQSLESSLAYLRDFWPGACRGRGGWESAGVLTEVLWSVGGRLAFHRRAARWAFGVLQ
jgi:hypothetical protein